MEKIYAISSCQESTVNRIQLCSDDIDYNKALPDRKSEKEPAYLDQLLKLSTVAEFDDKQSTLTLNFLLHVSWNDTRLGVKTGDPKM